MSDFKRYPSITNLHISKLEEFCKNVPEDEVWCVSEKIHGANFQISCNNDQVVTAGTRNKLANASDLETFHKCGLVVNEMTPKIQTLQQELKCDIIVFGELFGGQYPGVQGPNKQKPVQKEILYCPNLSFAAFDICVNGKFLSKLETIELCKKHTIFYVPLLYKGSCKEAIAYSFEHFADPSDVHTWFNLSRITNVPNIREGHVIQPNNVYYSQKGDRIIIKHKNEIWCERKVQTKESKEATCDLLTQAKEMITENRLKNILSHGDLSLQDPSYKLIGPMVKDIIKEMEDEVDEKDRHTLQKLLNFEVKSQIAQLLTNLKWKESREDI